MLIYIKSIYTYTIIKCNITFTFYNIKLKRPFSIALRDKNIMKKITTKIVQRRVCNFEILTAKSTVRDNVDELMIEVSFYENFNIKSNFVQIGRAHV